MRLPKSESPLLCAHIMVVWLFLTSSVSLPEAMLIEQGSR